MSASTMLSTWIKMSLISNLNRWVLLTESTSFITCESSNTCPNFSIPTLIMAQVTLSLRRSRTSWAIATRANSWDLLGRFTAASVAFVWKCMTTIALGSAPALGTVTWGTLLLSYSGQLLMESSCLWSAALLLMLPPNRWRMISFTLSLPSL